MVMVGIDDSRLHADSLRVSWQLLGTQSCMKQVDSGNGYMMITMMYNKY